MLQTTLEWLRQRWKVLAAGAAAWTVLAAGGAGYASFRGMPAMQQVVNWGEWAVALALIPAFILAILGIFVPDDVKSPRMKAFIRALNVTRPAVLVIFLLCLITRAVFRLGWQTF